VPSDEEFVAWVAARAPALRRAWSRVVAVSLAAVVIVGGLGVLAGSRDLTSGPAVPGTPTPTGPGSPATDLWRPFPVTADPRPIVMAGPSILEPADAYPSADAKTAFYNGSFVLRADLPSGPDSENGFPLVSAESALHSLRASGASQGPAAPGTAQPPLEIVGVRLGEAEFGTDRGYRTLPAWLFQLGGMASPAAVLAVASPALYRPPVAGYSTVGHVEAGGAAGSRTFVLHFVGAQSGTGPCSADYVADVVEAPWAVSVAVQKEPSAGPTGPVACYTVGYTRQLLVTLDQPLGNRVLVDDKGELLPVATG